MAIQSSTGSISPTPTTGDFGTGTNTNNGPKSLSPSSSIPFSFLIAFIALFLFFLGCGLGTRRVAWAFRRGLGVEGDFVDGLTIAGGRKRKKGLQKPEIWDVWPNEVRLDGKWDAVQPISAKPVVSRTDPPSQPEATTTSQPHPGTIIFPLDSSLGYFSSRVGRMAAPIPSYAVSSPRPRPTRLSGRTPSHADRTARPNASRPNLFNPSNARDPQLTDAPNLQPPNMAPSTDSRVPAVPAPPREPLWRRFRRYVANHPYVLALLYDMNMTGPSGRLSSDALDTEDEGEVEGMQVTVLIAMPSANPPSYHGGKRISSLSSSSDEQEKGKARETEKEKDEGFGDYVVGIAQVPWSKAWLDKLDDTSLSPVTGGGADTKS